ncbi:MAG: hypothetical protein WCP39_01975 [Chlamydiota bacterium]
MDKNCSFLIYSDIHPAYFETHIPIHSLLIYNSKDNQFFHYQLDVEKGEFYQLKPSIKKPIQVYMKFGSKEKVIHLDVLRSAIKTYHLFSHHKESFFSSPFHFQENLT